MNNGYPLPDGWRWARLGEVCELGSGRFLPRSQIMSQGPIPVYGANGIVGFTDKPCFDEPLLILGRVGSCGAVNVTMGPAWITDNTIVCKPREAARLDFLTLFLQTVDFDALRTASIQPLITQSVLKALEIPLPPLAEQKRIAAVLQEQMAAVERARAAAEAQLALLDRLTESYLRCSLSDGGNQRLALRQCLDEVTQGVGADWVKYPVLGVARSGVAPAKESVGKRPERYKLVTSGTIFYNPMRILLGSIGMLDDGDSPGITSPDYVVFKTKTNVVHHLWLYHWLRSKDGDAFIKTLTRGAVRERMLFRRLASAEMEIPPWDVQVKVACKLRIIRNTRGALTDQLQAIGELPAVLLRRAFRGEL